MRQTIGSTSEAPAWARRSFRPFVAVAVIVLLGHSIASAKEASYPGYSGQVEIWLGGERIDKPPSEPAESEQGGYPSTASRRDGHPTTEANQYPRTIVVDKSQWRHRSTEETSAASPPCRIPPPREGVASREPVPVPTPVTPAPSEPDSYGPAPFPPKTASTDWPAPASPTPIPVLDEAAADTSADGFAKRDTGEPETSALDASQAEPSPLDYHQPDARQRAANTLDGQPLDAMAGAESLLPYMSTTEPAIDDSTAGDLPLTTLPAEEDLALPTPPADWGLPESLPTPNQPDWNAGSASTPSEQSEMAEVPWTPSYGADASQSWPDTDEGAADEGIESGRFDFDSSKAPTTEPREAAGGMDISWWPMVLSIIACGALMLALRWILGPWDESATDESESSGVSESEFREIHGDSTTHPSDRSSPHLAVCSPAASETPDSGAVGEKTDVQPAPAGKEKRVRFGLPLRPLRQDDPESAPAEPESDQERRHHQRHRHVLDALCDYNLQLYQQVQTEDSEDPEPKDPGPTHPRILRL